MASEIFPRHAQNPTPSSSSRFDPIGSKRSPKRVKATPTPASPSYRSLPASNSSSGSGSRSRNRGKRLEIASSTSQNSSITMRNAKTPESADSRWLWPARRREMSVPLLSQTLSHFSLSQPSPPFASTDARNPLHHSTPPGLTPSNIFAPAPASSSFTPRRPPKSPVSHTPFGLPLPRDHVYPSTAPLPQISNFLGSPFCVKISRVRYHQPHKSPSKQVHRLSATEIVDAGCFGTPLEVYEGSEWMVDDLLGPATSDDDEFKEVSGVPRSRRDTSGSSSSVEDFSGSGTSLASFLSSGRSRDHHSRQNLIKVWTNEDDPDEEDDRNLPNRQLFLDKDVKSRSQIHSPVASGQVRRTSKISSSIVHTVTPQLSSTLAQSPLKTFLPRFLTGRRSSRSRSGSPALREDDAIMTDVEDTCIRHQSSSTATSTSSPLIQKAERSEGVGLGLYDGARQPFEREKTVTIEMARSASSASSTEIDQSPSRPFSAAAIHLSPHPAQAPPLLRRKTDTPEEVLLPIKPRPAFRRGITEPRMGTNKAPYLSATLNTPPAGLFGDVRPSPAAFASTGLVKKRSGISANDLPKFGDGERVRSRLTFCDAISPSKAVSPARKWSVDTDSSRSVSSGSTTTIGSQGAKGRGLRRKGSAMFGATTSPGNLGSSVSPVTPTKTLSNPSTIREICTPPPIAPSVIAYPFAAATTSPSPGLESSSPCCKSTLPARVRQLSAKQGPVARASNPMLSATYRAHGETATNFTDENDAVQMKRGRLDKDFSVVSSLGTGEFSQVWKVKDRSEGRLWAIKAGKPYTGVKNRLRQLEEVAILRQLSLDAHPNIITFVDSWEHSSRVYIRTELIPCGDLSRFLEALGDQNGLGEARVWKTLSELASGLSHIHFNNYIHLDLKPSNILITSSGSLKIADFGMSTLTSSEGFMVPYSPALPDLEPNGGFVWSDATRAVEAPSPIVDRELEGDREYLCPEALTDGPVGRAADIYSLGILLLEAALNVMLPSNGEGWVKLRSDDFSDLAEHYRIRASSTETGLALEDTATLPTLSELLIDTIRKMMASDPTRRMTLVEVMNLDVMKRIRGQEGVRAALVEEAEEGDWLRQFVDGLARR